MIAMMSLSMKLSDITMERNDMGIYKYSSKHDVAGWDEEFDQHYEIHDVGRDWDERPVCEFCKTNPAFYHFAGDEMYPECLTCSDNFCMSLGFGKLASKIYKQIKED